MQEVKEGFANSVFKTVFTPLRAFLKLGWVKNALGDWNTKDKFAVQTEITMEIDVFIVESTLIFVMKLFSSAQFDSISPILLIIQQLNW